MTDNECRFQKVASLTLNHPTVPYATPRLKMLSGEQSSAKLVQQTMGFSQAETVGFSRRSTFLGVSIFLIDVVLLLFLMWGALCASNLWLQLVCSLVAGNVLALLFTVGHDAGHESLTPHPQLNAVIGRLAMIPVLHALSLWKLVHNQTHHRWTNLSPEDYVWTPLSQSDYESLSRRKQFAYRFYRGLAGPVFYYFIEFWLKKIILPSRKEVRGKYKTVYLLDILSVFVFAGSYLAFLINGGLVGRFQQQAGVLNSLLFGFVLPFAVFNTMVGFVIYLHHTHPGIRWFNDKAEWKAESHQSRSAAHIIFPGPVNFIFHWIMEHNAHHERPSIPLYNLRAAQNRLEDYMEDHVVMKWNLRSHYDVVRRCKLYDYECHRWLDFSGEYTSESLRPRTAPAPHFDAIAKKGHVTSIAKR